MRYVKVLFDGDSAACAPYVGIAKKLARQCAQRGIRNKTWLVQDGTRIRSEWYGGDFIKVWIKAGGEIGIAGFPFDASADEHNGWVPDEDGKRVAYDHHHHLEYDRLDLYGPGGVLQQYNRYQYPPRRQPEEPAAWLVEPHPKPRAFARLDFNRSKLDRGQVARNLYRLTGNQAAYAWTQIGVDAEGKPLYRASDPVVSWWHSSTGDGPMHFNYQPGFFMEGSDFVSARNPRWQPTIVRSLGYEYIEPWNPDLVAGVIFGTTTYAIEEVKHSVPYEHFVFPCLYKGGKLVHRVRLETAGAPFAQVAGVHQLGGNRALMALTVNHERVMLAEAAMSAADPNKADEVYPYGGEPYFYNDTLNHPDTTYTSPELYQDGVNGYHAHCLWPWRFSPDGTRVSAIVRAHCFYDQNTDNSGWGSHQWVPRRVTATIDLENKMVSSVEWEDFWQASALSDPVIGLAYKNSDLIIKTRSGFPAGLHLVYADIANEIYFLVDQLFDPAGYRALLRVGDVDHWLRND